MLKVCTKCGLELDINKFGKLKSSKDGLSYRCKCCNREDGDKYRKENGEKEKERLQKYYIENKNKVDERNKKYNLNNSEKVKERQKKYTEKNVELIKEYRKKYKKENNEKIIESSKRYYIGNKEQINEVHKIYKSNNKEEISERGKIYRGKNIEVIRESSKIYKSENKEKGNVLTQKRNARKLLLPSTFTAEQWEETKIYFNQKCCYCGRELPLQMEHFIPVSKGGGYVKSNIICSCGRCNQSKNDSEFNLWYKNKK